MTERRAAKQRTSWSSFGWQKKRRGRRACLQKASPVILHFKRSVFEREVEGNQEPQAIRLELRLSIKLCQP